MNALTVATLLAIAWIVTGCSEPTDNMTSDISEFEEEIRRSLEEFENRTIYSSLDPDVLASIPDDKLEQAILDYVVTKIGADWDNMRETVNRLPDSFRGFYATWWLEAEVNNGGFNQYFWNPYGYWIEDAIIAFEDYGANEYAEVAKKAITLFLSEIDTHKEFRKIGTLEAFSESYKHTDLGDLDNEFFAIKQELSALRIAYVRQNPEQFIGN
jgi:hypothetical protein